MSANPESIEALAAALRLVAIGGRELWGFDEIAAYSKLSRNYIVNWVTAQPDFPKAIRIGKDGRGHPRYIACEVMAWFEAHKDV